MPESIVLILILKESVLKCTAYDADMNVTDAAARVRQGVATRRHKVKNGHSATLIHEQSPPIREHGGGSIVPP